jgi:hypothetical protein
MEKSLYRTSYMYTVTPVYKGYWREPEYLFYELYILFMWFEWTVDGPQCQYNIQEGYYFVIVSEMWEAITIHYIVLVEYSHTCLKGLLYIINPCL